MKRTLLAAFLLALAGCSEVVADDDAVSDEAAYSSSTEAYCRLGEDFDYDLTVRVSTGRSPMRRSARRCSSRGRCSRASRAP